MADDTAPAPVNFDPDQITAMLQRLGVQPPTQAPVSTEGGPATHGIGGFLSDVGTALSGGSTGLLGLSPDEQAAAGRHALLRFGIDMLAASGKSYAPKDFGTVLAAGLGGAQQAQQESENRAYVGRGAQQQLAQQAFQNRLSAIKEALPLLIAGQNAQIPNPLVGGGGKPNTSITAAANVPAYGGAVNAPQMPAEYEPYFQEASQKTGIPVEVLKAQAAQESGFNPGATGSAGEVGLFQIHPKTATNPGYGMQGVKDPAELRDPRSNILFGAQYLKARAGNADLSTPQGQAAALKAYNGGGDPNYVANVFRYMPGSGTQVAAAKPPAATTPPPAAPAAATPPGRVQVATADTGTKTDATPAPAAGTPVGNLGLVRNPDGTVGTPNAGGLGTGGAAATAPPAQQTFEGFQKLHPVAVDPASYAVEPPDLAALQRSEAAAAQQLSLARAGRGGDPDKATAEHTAAAKAITDAQAAATAKSAELRQKAQQAATDTQRQLYDAEMQRQQTAAENDKNRQNQIDLEARKGDEARRTAAAASENSFVLDTRKKLTDERSAAQENVDNLGLLDNLSKAAGAATPLDSLNWGGMPLRQWLLQKNIGSADQIAHWGAQQAYEAAINQTVIGLRKGVSMGALSDRDLSFLQGMSPSVLQRPDTREAVTAYLRSAQLRKIRFADSVDELWDGGKGMSYGQALIAARKQLPDIVPQIPAGASNTEKRDWFTKNVPPGTLYRNASGDLTVWPGMPGADRPQVPRD